MQLLWPLLTAVVLPTPAHPATTPSGWQAVVEQHAKLDPASQRRWIRGLLVRLDRASQAVLPPRQVARQRAGDLAILRELGHRRKTPQPKLLELLEQVDQREKAAIERLARRFRIRVYRAFRHQRDRFKERRAAWDRVLGAWRAAGSRFEHQPRLIDWLQAAIRSCTPGTLGPLPPEPTFAPPADAPQPPGAQGSTKQAETPGPAGVRQEPARGAQAEPRRRGPDRRAARRQKPSRPAAPPVGYEDAPLNAHAGQWSEPARLPPVPVLSRQSAQRRPAPQQIAVARPLPAPDQDLASLRPPAARASPAGVPPVEPTPRTIGADVAPARPRRAGAGLPKIGAPPPSAASPPDPRASPLPLSGTPRRPFADDEPTAAANVTRQPPRSQPTAGAMIPLSVIPLPMPDNAAPAAPQRPRPALTRSAVPAGRINLDELSARIAGANLALRALEAELDEQRPWNARRLRSLIDRLEILVVRSNDLATFRGLLSPQERALVGRLESPQPAISLLAARIFEARTHAAGPDFTGTPSRRRAELRRLDELSRRLAELAAQGSQKTPPDRRRPQGG